MQITVRAFGVGRVRLGRHIHSELLLGLFLLYLAGKPENIEKDVIRFLVIRGLLTAKGFEEESWRVQRCAVLMRSR